jgi:hypothetical protein
MVHIEAHKQHYGIYPLLYYMEEAEKKRHGDD